MTLTRQESPVSNDNATLSGYSELSRSCHCLRRDQKMCTLTQFLLITGFQCALVS